jgi:hypothetical protein
MDPLIEKRESPDRLFYATGVLLDAEDFEAEQRYHRGRLARALAYAHGSGTVAGLRAVWMPRAGERTERLLVEPGMAVDRLGRIVEIPRTACIRVQRWWDDQPDDALEESHQDPLTFTPDFVTWVDDKPESIVAGTTPAAVTGVVVDLFIRFVTCERGKTPAFATGPFDALDAVQPSRLRDGYELSLVPRRLGLPLPESKLPDLDGIDDAQARMRKLQDHLFGAWQETEKNWNERGLAPAREHVTGQDTSSVFLARIAIPATKENSDRPVRVPDTQVRVDNHSRQFVYTARALGRVLGAL